MNNTFQKISPERKIIALLLIFLSPLLFAQTHPKQKGEIRGRVADENNRSMEYVNIRLYRQKDSTLVDGNITGKKGRFQLDNIAFGKYFLKIQFLGYRKETLPDIILSPQEPVINTGTIHLQPVSQHLDEVTVKGERRRIEYRLDKKVVHVSEDLLAKGETAVEILENVPSVQVDIEGNVRMRGSEDFQVLIDGRPGILSGSDVLRQIPASNIEKIEIITNPSAKYSAEGTGGILNIILKKKRTHKLDGIINLSYATRNKYSADALFSKKRKRWTFKLGGNYGDRDRLFTLRSEDCFFFPDSTGIRKSATDGSVRRQSAGLKGGIEYQTDRQLILSVDAEYGSRRFEKNFISHRVEYPETMTNEQYSRTENFVNKGNEYYELVFSVEKPFDENSKLTLFTTLSGDDGLDNQVQKDVETDNEDHVLRDSLFILQNTYNSRKTRALFQIDYSRSLGEKSKLEMGFQGRLTDRLERFSSGIYTPATAWGTDPKAFDDGNFSQNINALYITYGNQIHRFSYQLGIRGEFAKRIYQYNQTTPSEYSYNDIFPSLHLSQELKNKDMIYAGYSKRIRRPGSWYLNPVPQYSDAYHYRTGNPALAPEYIHSLEAGYQKTAGRSFVSLEGFFRLRKNKFTRIKTIEAGNTIKSTYVNLDKDISSGLELGSNVQFSKAFSIHTNISYYYYQIFASSASGSVEKSSTNLSARLNGKLKLPAGIRFQASLFYLGPSVSLQGRRKAMFFSSFAAQKSFFDRKLSVSLKVKDPFGTAKHAFITETENYYSEGDFRRESPVFGINISYIINNFKKERKKEKDDDEEMGEEF